VLIDLVLLAIDVVLASVALALGVIAYRALTQLRELEKTQSQSASERAASATASADVLVADIVVDESDVFEVSGRAIMVPEEQRLVAMREFSRPSIRIAVVWAGVAHALRPESRDKIARIVRTEYKRRRRTRLRAGRRAARAAHEPAVAQPVSESSKGRIGS
jgi:hypothetical protein